MFKIKQKDLVNSLKTVKNTVGKGKDGNQSDKYIYFVQKQDNGNFLELTTTNYTEISKSYCNVEIVGKPEKTELPLVDFNLFNNLINTFDSESILELDFKDKVLSVRDKKKPIKITGTDPSIFLVKDINEKFNNKVTMTASSFIEVVEKVSIVIGSNDSETDIVNTHIFMSLSNQQIFAKALSKSKRMGLVGVNTSSTGKGKYLLEASKIKKILPLLDPELDIEINSNDNIIMIKQGHNQFLFRVTNGEYPKIEKFITAKCSNIACFNKNELLSSLKRVQIMNDSKKTCVLEIQPMTTTISTNTNKGVINETVTTKLTGEETKVGIFCDLLIDTINNINAQEIEIHYKDNKSLILCPHNCKTYLQRILVMCTNIGIVASDTEKAKPKSKAKTKTKAKTKAQSNIEEEEDEE